ncbi:MAG: Hsp33 family molecular chaperone HslO [Bdellovibrionia bacterium]
MSSAVSSRWLKCISTEGTIRGVAIQATELVRSMVEMHQLQGAGARALGEAVIGALLIASYCKDKERINLNIRGSKGIFQALVDAYPDGTVRGYIVEKSIELPDDGIVFEDPRQGPWGEGMLSVLRTKTQEREQPYIGTVPLVTGHLAKDLTFYWMQSEQVPSSVGIAVEMKDDQVVAAGGFLVQAMPGASEKEVKLIDDHIHEMHSLAEQLATNSDPLVILSKIFQDTAFVLLEEKPLEFKCTCSWERVRKALTLVGTAELSAMLNEDHSASVRCDFCTKEYRADEDELKKLIAEAREREGG